MKRFILAATLMMLTGCQQASTSLAGPSPRLTATPDRSTATLAATPSAGPPTLVIEKTGASVAPGGFLAFALISNPSDRTAIEVSVEIDARGAAGQVLASGKGSVAQIGPRSKGAVGVHVAQGRSLPATFTAVVKSVTWRDSPSVEPVSVIGTTFLGAPQLPAVRVRLQNHGSGNRRAVITTVCYDASGDLRGGGTESLVMQANAIPTDVLIQVDVPVTPSTCESFAAATG